MVFAKIFFFSASSPQPDDTTPEVKDANGLVIIFIKQLRILYVFEVISVGQNIFTLKPNQYKSNTFLN